MSRSNRSVSVCLLDVLSKIPCSRRARGQRYPLKSVLALVLVGILSGCRNYSQIYVFAKSRPKLLKHLGFRPPKYPRKTESRGRIAAPNEDTLGRVVASVSTDDLNTCLSTFLVRMVRRGSRAAIDGKALRGAKDYVLSVFANDVCQVVWQENVGTKENELSCLERSLSSVLDRYPNLRLFTGDAGFCHKSVARTLVKARRDYLLQLKAPHTGDVALAKKAFEKLTTREPLAETVEKRGHRAGRKS
jgi:hypothetical protein